MRRILAGLILLSLSTLPLQAQDSLKTPTEPPEWEEVSKETLRADDYPADSNASAVIISDVGEGRFARNGEIEIEHHTRIKILDEDGFDSGTVTVPFYAEDGMQEVRDVEGRTYTLDSTGTIQTYELDNDDVYEEDVDGEYQQIRFTLPNLEPGAVIEYEYEFDSKNWRFIPSWTFQHGEPTLYSEYRMHIPSFLEYVTLKTGTQNFDTVDQKGNAARGELEKWWIMTDVPALREEPYITTLEDYRSRLRLQIQALRNPRTGAIEERFMSSWEDLAETMMEADYFGKNLGEGGGGLFGGEGAVETHVQQVTDGAKSDSAKMHALYDYVRSSIEWNGTVSRGRSKDFDEVLETQTGNSAEVNLLLVSMLQNAGVEADPVLLSTRDHGKMFPLYPFVRQFNAVIAAVDLPNRDSRILLDATEPMCPPSLLPERNLNRQGWLVQKGNPRWIEVPATNQTRRQIYVRGSLSPDGTLSGNLTVTDRGYNALESRRSLKGTDSTAFVQDDLLDALTEVSLSDVSVSNEETVRKPLKTAATIESPGYAQAAGNMLYVNPQIIPFYSENPLKRKDRTFPVDFAHPRSISYTLSLRLPEGYQVADAPKPQRIKLPNNEGQFVRLIQAGQGRLVLRSKMTIQQPRIPPQRYKALRELFSRVVSAQSEQVVLEKTETASSASSPDE